MKYFIFLWDTVVILSLLVMGLGVVAPYLVSSDDTAKVFLGVLTVPATLSVALGYFLLVAQHSLKDLFK